MPPHRLQTDALYALGEPVRYRPKLPQGAEARSVSGADDALIFRLHLKDGTAAEGHRSGVYRQSLHAEPEALELLAADEGGVVYGEPQLAGDVVVLKRVLPTGAPSTVAEIVFARPGEEALIVAGQQVAISADDSTAVVVNAERGLEVIDLQAAKLSARHLKTIEFTNAQQTPLPALTPDGSTVMVSSGGAGITIDVASGAERQWLPAGASSARHVMAAVGAEEAVVLTSFSDEGRPRSDLVHVTARGPTSLLKTSLSQPQIAPVVHGDAVFAALTLEPYGEATYGPIALVSLSLRGGSHRVVAELDRGVLRCRVRQDVLYVEGGDALWAYPLKAD